MQVDSLIAHIEAHLGRISSSWVLKESATHVQVVKFEDVPTESVSTFVTLGLSHHLLALSEERSARQEFIFAAYQKFDPEAIASMLLMYSSSVINRHTAILRGSVECSDHPIIPNSSLTCLYATIPTLFPHTFDLFRRSEPPTVFVWLIALHRSEAAFIESHGWSSFEAILEIQAPDILDMNRLPMV